MGEVMGGFSVADGSLSGVVVLLSGVFSGIAVGELISSLYLLVHCSCSALIAAYLSLADCRNGIFFFFFFRFFKTRLRLPGALKNIARASLSRYRFAAREFGVRVLVVFFLSKIVVANLKHLCGVHPGALSEIFMHTLGAFGDLSGSCLRAFTKRRHLALSFAWVMSSSQFLCAGMSCRRSPFFSLSYMNTIAE